MFLKNHLNRKDQAFTLIELLIVVAIIAILAAIAVPNFLEAQIRSKVSRIKSDQRSMATALESYCIDWNRYPEYHELSETYPYLKMLRARCFQLTTPVAYISSLPVDIFNPGRDKYSINDNNVMTYGDRISAKEYREGIPKVPGQPQPGVDPKWVIISYGPYKNPWQTYEDRAGTFAIPYDPTNGTASVGTVFRTGP